MIGVRLAIAEEGEAVKRLLEAAGYWWAKDCDWSDLRPFWLVAEKQGRIVGTLQTIYAQPVSRIEFLAVDPGLRKIDRAWVVKELCAQAWAGLKECRASYVAFMVNEAEASWRGILERHGAFVIDSGPLMMLRC